MNKLQYLNVGCGAKYHKSWVNADMAPANADVLQCNLLEGISFADNSFDVVYHSQVIEHIPKEKALFFIEECYRVLKPGGTLRIVTPDLESIARNYLSSLENCLAEPSEMYIANYEWMLLEMYDQSIRDKSGGNMALVLQKNNLLNKAFIVQRTGLAAMELISKSQMQENNLSFAERVSSKGGKRFFARIAARVNRFFLKLLLSKHQQKEMEVGKFRLSGEIHYWMYDRFSLSKLLSSCGFKKILVKSPFESDIPDWKSYELDVKDGMAYDPGSLFIEAKK